MIDPRLAAFSQLLAETTDPSKRAQLFAIAQSAAVKMAPPEAFEPPIRTLGEYLEADIEVPPVLVEPKQVVRGGLNAIIGRSGKGKTVFSLNRLLRWSVGKPIFDGLVDKDGNPVLAPVRPLKCLIIENEGAAGMFHLQVGIMLHAEGYLTEDDRKQAKENVLIWGDGGYSNLKVDDPAKWEPVRRGVDKHAPDIVFIEPFRSLWKGEENSATEMSVVVDNLVALAAEFECAVQIAHHEKKGGSGEDDKMSAARGSTVLENFVTVMENFEGVKGVDRRELSFSKSRHGKAPNPIQMEWQDGAWWYKWFSTGQIEEGIVDALRDHDGAMTISDLVEVTGQTKERLRKLCSDLYEKKLIARLPSQPTENGSTGFRYAVSATDDENYGGLSV